MLPTDRRIRVFCYFRIFYRRSDHERYLAAKRRLAITDLEDAHQRAKIAAAAGFRELDSLADLVYNITRAAMLLAERLHGTLRTAWIRWSQKRSVDLAEASLKTGSRAKRDALEAAARALSLDDEKVTKETTRTSTQSAFTEVAAWVNTNTVRNLELFRRRYGDPLGINEEKEPFVEVLAVLIVVTESVAVPMGAVHLQGYYYHEV